MDEKMELIQENELEEVVGGAGVTRKHVKIVNCKNFVNVRSSPDSKSDKNIIGKAFYGDCYLLYGWSGNWAKVQFGSGTAYIYKDFVQKVLK